MFIIRESLSSALISINAHKMRSFLTALGIIIGVAAVIALVSIIQGLSYSIGRQFEGLGTNSLTISSYTPVEERLKGRLARLSEADLDLVRRRVEGVSSITPLLYSPTVLSSAIRYGSQVAYATVQGTTYSFQDVAKIEMAFGRFLLDNDDLTRRRVAIIGEDTRENLSLPENPVGEYIEINGEWIKVIGLAKPKGKLLGLAQDDFVMLPYSTMQSLLGAQMEPDIQIQLVVDVVDDTDAVRRRITELLREAHELPEGVDEDFQVQTPEQIMETFSSIINMITLVMGGIVSISLLVSGIGIMNIMLVSVSERTREIGICKAIGARRSYILLQFLLESLTLCLLGGIMGLVLGYLFGGLISLIPGFPAPHVPLWAALVSFGFSAMVGVVFGIVPAAKAANFDPIVALRYE